jgi:zinc finger SWIM domain-containing protein 3
MGSCFQYDKFFLDMKSNQRSESLNSNLHRHQDIYMSLLDLVEHYKNYISRLHETEAEYDCRASESMPVPLTSHSKIKMACSYIFMAANFYMLQHELLKINYYHIREKIVANFYMLQHELLKINYYHIQDKIVAMDSSRYFQVHNDQNISVFLVDYWFDTPGDIIRCICHKMEHYGLPCTHIFHILDHLKRYKIPKCCML